MEVFLIQIDQCLAAHRKSYFDERNKLDSMFIKAGQFNSGRAIITKAELAKDNLKVAADEIFKLSLTYAGHEGVSHIDLVRQAESKLHAYKRELFGDLEKANKNGISGAAPLLEQTKTDLDALVTDKAKVALGGWVNKEKIYSGNLISPSLRFFNSLCLTYDGIIEDKAPQLKQRLNAAYESMESENPSHWANAVHECRKIFEDLADLVFPAQSTPQIRNGQVIKVGQEQFKNRLTCYVESKSDSKSYDQVVTTQLEDFHAKLDALVNTTQKGSHASITKEHAALYIGYIYLIIGSILSL